jgi:hypothetical protein
MFLFRLMDPIFNQAQELSVQTPALFGRQGFEGLQQVGRDADHETFIGCGFRFWATHRVFPLLLL